MLQIIDSTYRGGAQKVVLEIVKSFPEFKHIVCYWAPGEDLNAEFQAYDATLVRMPFDGMRTIYRAIRFVTKVCDEFKVNIIHAHMVTPHLIAYAVSRRRKIRIVRTYHGECFFGSGWRKTALKSLERFLFLHTPYLIAVSEHVRHYIGRELNVKVIDIKVVYNFAEQLPIVNKKVTLPLRMVATSNNQPYKNYPLLLRALRHVEHQPITLDVYGAGMEKLTKSPEFSNLRNVRFLGSIQDVAHALTDYDVFTIASSGGEGFSISVLEAMNAGLPILCSDIPQFVEAVGEDGIFFQNNNLASLVDRINEIISQPSQLLEKSKRMKQRSMLFSREAFKHGLQTAYGV